ncbi:AF4/FMR2 family member 1 isoform X4 [Trachemys scripta elegans]|uniref:AF4/FMR2 family member 1 isoform X4 n=1 Tax=Trachemys scripta elegans TaxID=31138 RepID=UPI001555592B|nr:AF4/FMR2 family member 1 isoform X4 [Trachemys scripta elegans]
MCQEVPQLFPVLVLESLYNEDRNLLRIRERERRNQEALQERETYPENAPLFAEPYKTNKEDELSSRIQNMLGNYEEVKELISTKSHQNLIGIPKSIVPLIHQGKPDRPFFPEKTSSTLPTSFQHSTRHQAMGPPGLAPPSASNSIRYPKTQARMEPAASLHTKSHSLSSGQSQGPEQRRSGQESHRGGRHKKNDRRVDENGAAELQATLSELSPLLSSLSSPLAPLSPLHSSQHIHSRSQNNNKSHGQTYNPMKSPQDFVAGLHDNETRDSSAINLAQPSSQTFPPALPPKNSAMQQKPTAYVRPMDGQDQAPNESPELKPLPEEYPGQPYGKIADLKANAKAKLSKLKIPSEPIEQTFPNEVHCVEEILKEMTHSWPPPLTAIHTPSTAEPSKFPFPIKESQLVGSVIQNQKQYDAPSKTLPNSQQGTSMLQDDLQLSDSEDSDDDRVSEKPPPSSAPPSASQSQPESVASAHSSSAESGSTSDSDSSSDSESESSSSDSEANEPPRTSTSEPDPPTSNKWQLDNWLTKVNQPAAPNENLSEVVHRHGHQESKGQGKSSSSSSHERSESNELHSKNSSKITRAPQAVHLPSKRTCQKSPTRTEEPSRRPTVGTKKPSKVPQQEAHRGSLKVESEPGPYGVKDQSSRDKPKVKTKGRPKSRDKKELKPMVQESLEKKKHKSSHQAIAKAFLDPKPVKDIVAGGAPEHFPLSPVAQSQKSATPTRTSGKKPAIVVREDFHRDKLLLPIRDKTLLSPLRDFPIPHALVVKIELCLLSRIPQPPGKGSRQKKLEGKELPSARKQDLEKKSTETPNKPLKKRKGEVEKETDKKKIKLEKETKSLLSSSHKDSSKMKVSKFPSETLKKELLLPPPLPPMSTAQPAQKPAKMAQKRHKGESNTCSQLPATNNRTAKSKSNHKDSSSSKHRKVEGKHSEHSKSNKGPSGDVKNPFPVPSLPNGTSKPRRPQIKFEKQHPMEYHIEEAKRLKHKADTMTDKVAKAFQYLEAALSFIEYGIAMESDALTPKSAYTIFTDTIDLLKFIMTLKSFSDTSASAHEKIFAVLCMRCQSILHMAMFRYKKDTAVKYSRTLNEHFKNSSRVTQAPSPCVASTGTPSPLSPMPSPASSVSSQPGSNASNCGSGAIGSSINTLHNIPSITFSYVNITSYILYAYDIWEQADALARKNKEFFAELSTAVCTLALNSSMTELVHYTRQGLQWLRLETNTP